MVLVKPFSSFSHIISDLLKVLREPFSISSVNSAHGLYIANVILPENESDLKLFDYFFWAQEPKNLVLNYFSRLLPLMMRANIHYRLFHPLTISTNDTIWDPDYLIRNTIRWTKSYGVQIYEGTWTKCNIPVRTYCSNICNANERHFI